MSAHDTQDADLAAGAISAERQWRHLMAMAEIGATAKGGVNRQAFSAEDRAARARFAAWGRDLGCTVYQDGIGNLFLRRAGRRNDLAPVVTGSHLDSQPTGGRFDGAYGVIAGLEVLAALHQAGITTLRPIEAVAWANEEGSRFQPGAMGSLVFAGQAQVATIAASRDWDGRVLADELVATLAALPDAGTRPGANSVAAYVEAHIEQGPRLEQAGLPIGVVSGVQGSERWIVTCTGEEAHAGTTPRAARRDALQAALACINALNAAFADAEDAIRFTVGRIEAKPGSPNTVPGSASFTIDLRHPDAAALSACGATIAETVPRMAATLRCEGRAERVSHVDPVAFDAGVMDRVRTAATRLGLASMDMVSGAGHDAMHIARLAPTGMIFTPCARGQSHIETEYATPEQLAAGTRVLAAVLVELANA